MEQMIRVFIADASVEYTELLRSVLEQEEDFLVVGTAVRGDRALEALPGCRADLLITDLLLPGLDGLSLLRRLKEQGQLPHALVVSVFFNDRIARVISDLADNYLPKPCRTEDLVCHMRESVLGTGRAFVREYEPLVTRLLIDCGLMPHLNGFDYLRSALLRTLDDRTLLRGVTKALYRDIAREYGTNAACVERSMRSAIDRAWARISPRERRSSFGALFDAFPEAPSNVPFLTVMTEYIGQLYESDAGIG